MGQKIGRSVRPMVVRRSAGTNGRQDLDYEVDVGQRLHSVEKRELQRASVEPDEDADLQAEDAEEEEDDVSDLQAEDDDDEEERTMQITSWRPKKTKKRTKKHNRNSASSLKRAALRNALRALQL